MCVKNRCLTRLVFAFICLFITACATAPEDESPPIAAPPTETATPTLEDGAELIDLEGLQRSVGLTRPEEVLGYQEATFNSCSAGFGFSSSQNCRRVTMAVIHFRLQCRDSEGTVSTALGASDLRPIAGQNVRWTISKLDGVALTDGEGYGVVRGLFTKSPKAKWLRLAVGVQFLNMRAGEITRVVTPRPWCNGQVSRANYYNSALPVGNL